MVSCNVSYYNFNLSYYSRFTYFKSFTECFTFLKANVLILYSETDMVSEILMEGFNSPVMTILFNWKKRKFYL